MIDYHVHTARCGHAEGEMVEYVRRARELLLTEIGFADHLPLIMREDPTLAMSEGEFDDYIAAVRALDRDTEGIVVRAGIEADFFPGREDETAALLARHELDYVIGSIHFIDGWGFDDSRYIEGYRGRDIYELYTQYFELVAGAAASGLFDIIGHLDLIKKYNFRPVRDITALVEETVLAIKDADVCIEINTAGLRKPAGEMYPSEDILALCFRAGVPVTLGSDAHWPGQVGMDFTRALRAARAAGYTKLAVFEKRERRLVELG